MDNKQSNKTKQINQDDRHTISYFKDQFHHPLHINPQTILLNQHNQKFINTQTILLINKIKTLKIKQSKNT